MVSKRVRKRGLFKSSEKRLQVKDLKPNRPIKMLDLIILRVYPRRLIYSDSYTGPVAAACGRDETGLVGIVLWNEQIDEIRICLLYTSPSPRDTPQSRMPSSA